MKQTNELLKAMKLPKKLALDFFITFSRFEYVLVWSGYHKRNSILPDWDAFANALRKNVPEDDLQPLLDAGKILLKKPPQRLELENGRPRFNAAKRGGQSDINWLISGIQRARNNLFHGGKYQTPSDSPNRNKEVITSALSVLQMILEKRLLNCDVAYNDLRGVTKERK